jgi:NagD protein
MHTMLVLTGITSREMAERFPYRPSRIVDSVADVVEFLGEPAVGIEQAGAGPSSD